MSNKSMPSLLALLGLVAVAGYQNRGKLRDMMADARTGAGTAGGAAGSGIGRLARRDRQDLRRGRRLRAEPEGGARLASRPFPDERSRREGEIRVSADANKDLGDGDLESAVGDDTLDELARRTGLSRAEVVNRLKTALPETINRLTPGGRLPDESEASRLI